MRSSSEESKGNHSSRAEQSRAAVQGAPGAAARSRSADPGGRSDGTAAAGPENFPPPPPTFPSCKRSRLDFKVRSHAQRYEGQNFFFYPIQAAKLPQEAVRFQRVLPSPDAGSGGA